MKHHFHHLGHIFPMYELVGSGGLFLGPKTNNIVEYIAVIKLLSKESSLGTRCLVFRLDSHLVVLKLNVNYFVFNPTLFQKCLRMHLLERMFEIILMIIYQAN